ncbi:uncharacterized protein SPPG_01829 [Spizellomyces punctatus DAOM BR117]|uniref:BZIP domain-containing protein n=1 Tax=Spizellomyces punctatus (strain DAOM BR117) TaxID=645134 RepID=A0A0L0HMU1_SPIPD|nr:uncharacterized protein SPPG_01829 [Spizellomyces punctatus DAOM BR117]KND02746.1 hypothetical protein SPPG_01829 [Spizellomyces punctatus DAOM BR117]|eukprot:XP_016610785.1 hypothetical protein SPPG_01829 [Spizellomyces punctatus DAOM BR117]
MSNFCPAFQSSKQKRRGRHRIFTDEQRKDRNRTAQAAFRAKKMEYYAGLESTVEDLQRTVSLLREGETRLTTALKEKETEVADLRREVTRLKSMLVRIVDGQGEQATQSAPVEVQDLFPPTPPASICDSTQADLESLLSSLDAPMELSAKPCVFDQLLHTVSDTPSDTIQETLALASGVFHIDVVCR